MIEQLTSPCKQHNPWIFQAEGILIGFFFYAKGNKTLEKNF
jgi:hypothetical protein